MNWSQWFSMMWELIKEWEIVKESLFQKILAYHVPSRIPLSDEHLSTLRVIVTGATNGIGLHTAKELAMAGAHVIMACRNIKAAHELVNNWRGDAGSTKILNVEVMELDLSSLSSVRRFAAEWERRGEPLHVLINNAGMLDEGPQKFCGDGIEQHIQVNHVAPSLLTLLLLPSLLKASSPRIINVNSVGHLIGTVDTRHWNSRMEEDNFNFMKVYGTSKLANLMFLKALATQLSEKTKNSIECIAVHPGAVCTNLSSSARTKLFFMFDAAEGARSVLFCSTSNAVRDNLVKGFAYYSANCKLGKVSSKAADMNECFQIWKKTMNILGLSTDYVDHLVDTQ